MGRLLIVRHGETPWNAEGRLQGHADIDLSEKGRQQAREVAKRLADTPIDVAYSSDLARAWHTAQIVLDQRDVPLNSNEGLRERFYGVFEGLTVEERQAQFPDEFAASLIKDLEFASPGGESALGTLRRMTGVIGEIKERHLNETVLIVGHGGSLRSARWRRVSSKRFCLFWKWKLTMPSDRPANPVTVVMVVPEMPCLAIDSIVASISCWRRTSREAVRPVGFAGLVVRPFTSAMTGPWLCRRTPP